MTLSYFKPKPFWVLMTLVVCVSLSNPILAREPYIPEIKTVSAQLIYFRPALKQTFFEEYVGEHQVTYNETVLLRVGIPQKQYYAMPIRARPPSLYLGKFSYECQDGIAGPTEELDYHLTNWKDLPDGEPIIVTVIPGGPGFIPKAFANLEFPQFNHDMIVDNRWKVYWGFVDKGVEDGITVSDGPYATVTVNGGNLSLVTSTREDGGFDFYEYNENEGIKLESGESYTVEVIVNNIPVFSKVFTQETSDFPGWTLKVEPQESVFYVIEGHINDVEGNPLPNVTVTLEGEDGRQYTTTSSEIGYSEMVTLERQDDGQYTRTTSQFSYGEDGYYKLSSLFAGTYTLTATKEGYTFAPVTVTGGNGQPVTIDLVEKPSTQCLLYAVHDTAINKGRLKWVNPAEDLTLQNLPFSPEARQMSVAVADFDGDSTDEIAMAVQTGGHTITLAKFDGQTIRTISTPMNGLLLATGDLDGDEQPEIVVASRSANRNSVQSYAPDGQLSVISYQLTETIKLFEDNTRIAPALGDVDGDGKDDIIAGSLLKADQVVISHSATQQRQTFSVFQATQTTRKKTEKQKPQKPMYGVQVATGDFDGDGKDEIVAAQASKGSRVEIYQSNGTLQNAFEAFESQQGVVITVGNVIGDESPEILVGEAKGNLIRGFSVSGEQLFEFEAVKKGIVSSLAVFGCLE
jgi:hypothetical protein